MAVGSVIAISKSPHHPLSTTSGRPGLQQGPHSHRHSRGRLPHGGRRKLLRATTLQQHAAAWQLSRTASKAASNRLLPATECSLGSGCPVAVRHRESWHISITCGRVRAGELSCVCHSASEPCAAAPAAVSAYSQLPAARSATLLHAARRWVHLLLAQVVGGCRLVASPIALVELYRTGQVWHVGGGRGSRDRYPTTRS